MDQLGKNLPMQGIEVDEVVWHDPELHVMCHSTADYAECPRCGQTSSRVHSHHLRRLRDLPRDESPVVLTVRVRRFRCANAACPKRTFAERLPGLTEARAQRTTGLTRALHAIGLALGGEAGQRLARALAMPSSRDTVLRILRATPPLHLPAPTVIGVDDWAIRKAVNYGTIIVDLQTHHPFDLLPDRQADTLRDWLLQHPGITTIARDRSMEYARGIQAGAPGATQVIDRWHLLKNLREAAERLCNRMRGQVDALWTVAPPHLSVYARATQRYQNELNAGRANRAKRLRQYEQVHQLKAQGCTISQIARMVPLAMGTARKYYHAEQFPERKRHRHDPSALDPLAPYLQERSDQGCENAMQLWREIQGRGYTRGPKAVRQWVRLRRTHPAPTTAPAHQALQTTATAGVADLPSTRALAWLLTRAPEALMDDERVVVNTLRQHKTLDRAYELVQRFAQMTGKRKGEQLEQWIQDALASGVKELKTFAAGLQSDQSAAYAAMTLPWSNGPTEGCVNRLKLIKRQMFGRAKFDLLRIRVLHATRSTKPA